MLKIDYATLEKLAETTAALIAEEHTGPRPLQVYAVPRGGIPAALAVQRYLDIQLVSDPQFASIVVDDLIDSGATADTFLSQGKRVYALIDKRSDLLYKGEWIVWPWEVNAEGSLEDNIRRMLQFIGEDADRGGLLETPTRVAKAWRKWTEGYSMDPADALKTFEDGAEGVDEMVVVKDIPFYTHCEHHMAPFFGTATIGYLPDGKVVGLSKLSRLLDIYARRLQVQERLTCQVADAIMTHLAPKGCGVVIKARHLCMESRGVCKQGHHTVTSALRGVFKDEQAARSEFLALAR
jgi:GTP cyclohydrolase I